MNPITTMEALYSVHGVRRVTLLHGANIIGCCCPGEVNDIPDLLRRGQLERLMAIGSTITTGRIYSIATFIGKEVHQLVLLKGYTYHIVLRDAMILTKTLFRICDSAPEGSWNANESVNDPVKQWNGAIAQERAMKAAVKLVEKIEVINASEFSDENLFTTETSDAT